MKWSTLKGEVERGRPNKAYSFLKFLKEFLV